MSEHMFDETNITWRTLDWLPHIAIFVYNVDEENRIVDVVFKFAANQRVMLHRRKSPYVTLVMQGELRFYREDGSLKEIRPTGSYVSGVANGDPHTEGGGDEDAIVFFSNRNIEDALYEFLDDAGNPVQVLGIADFKAELEVQVCRSLLQRLGRREEPVWPALIEVLGRNRPISQSEPLQAPLAQRRWKDSICPLAKTGLLMEV